MSFILFGGYSYAIILIAYVFLTSSLKKYVFYN